MTGNKDALLSQSSTCVEPLEAFKEKAPSIVTLPPKEHNDETIIYRRIKNLYLLRRIAVILAAIFSLSGIILGVVSTEIAIIAFVKKTSSGDFKKPKTYFVLTDSLEVSYVRWAISVTTVILVILIVWDFILRRLIQVVEKNLGYFIFSLSFRQVGLLFLEMTVCAIHPMPLNYPITWPAPNEKIITNVREAPIEVILNMLMFLRIYQIARIMLLFSRFKRDSTAHSIAKINHVKLDYVFVFKSFMHLYPTRILIGCAAITFLWAAWAIRVCEMSNAAVMRDGYLKNLWFIGVTFLTIGYGDIIPDTYCGKIIALSTGVVGVFFTAMVIAVLSRKMELSRPERRIQEFLIEGEINTRIQNCAAEVIRLAWKKYQCKKTNLVERVKVEQRLLNAARKFRKLRTRRAYLAEKSLSFLDISHENERLERLLLNTLHELKDTRKEMRKLLGVK